MNIVMCILVGALLGWAGYAFLRFNATRGKMVSILIGAAGGFLGGQMLAPMFVAVPVTGDLSLPALIYAAGLATAFLAVGNLVSNRWGV